MEGGIDLLGLASYNPPPPPASLIPGAKDQKPSELNTINSSGLFQLVSPDKLSVQYAGNHHHVHDVGAVQADRPAPSRTITYYFEMTVKNAGDKGQVAIGFTCPNYNLRRQPGWEANSCGYHGDDGYIYHGHGKGEPFGPTYTTYDTVGAGINYATQEFFFTKNGKLIGTFEKDIKGPLYPTIAVHSQNEEVSVNFGKQAFLFDIKAFKSEERLKQWKVSAKLSLPPNVSHWIIRSYLLHYGYQDTLHSLDVESEITSPSTSTAEENGIDEGDAYALNHRKILRQLIRSGQIDSAARSLQEWYPQILQVYPCLEDKGSIDYMTKSGIVTEEGSSLAVHMKSGTSTICFLLHCQRFIEFIRDDQLLEAVSYARAELQKFLKVKPFEIMLENTVPLLAYVDPSKSCVGYLLKQSQRESVADAVNAAILSTNPNLKNIEDSMHSCLEKLLRQLTASCLERRALTGNQGEAFDLHKEQQLRWGWNCTDV